MGGVQSSKGEKIVAAPLVNWGRAAKRNAVDEPAQDRLIVLSRQSETKTLSLEDERRVLGAPVLLCC